MTELEKLEKELLQEIQEEPGIYENAEEFCTIDPETRTITVPLSKRILGTESDQETNRLYFKCPKVVGDNVDLSLFSLRINYQNAGNKKDQYLVEDIKEEGDTITFSWLLKRSVTAYKGNVKFILCAVKTTEDGAIKNEWNTTLNTECESLEGMEVDRAAVEEETKDIVEQLIAMMNQSAENAVHALETAKTEAIKAVQTEGTTQAGNVTQEGEKQIQAVQAAAQEIIADRGQIQENKTGVAKLKEDLEQTESRLSESIVEISNEFSRYNIFDKSKAEIASIMCNSSLVFISGGGVQSTIWKCEPNTTYTISWEGVSGNNRYIIYTSKDMPVINGTAKALRSINVSNVVSGSNRHYATITTTSEENYLLLYFWVNASGGEATLDKMQISNGSKLLDYVPYENYAMPNLKLVQQQFDGITIDVTNCTDDMAELLGVKNLGALDKGYICLVADDGYANVSNVTFSIVREKNVPVTLALWTDSEVITNPTLLSELRTMIGAYNVGICQHGAGHFTEYSPKGLYDYLMSEKAKWNTLSLDVRGVAYPNHSRNAQVRTICGALYGVCCSGGATAPMVYANDTLGARSNIFDLYRKSVYSCTEANLKSACDYAKSHNKLVIMFWHDNDIYGVDAQINKLKNVIEYAKQINLEFVKVGDIPMLT